MNCLGIYRSHTFSPNMQDKDAAIINAVGDILKAKGLHVELLTEEDFFHKYKDVKLKADSFDYGFVFTMSRGKLVLDILKYLEENNGLLVFNSAFGIDNCNRALLTEKFIEEDIPSPKSLVAETSLFYNYVDDIEFPCWIKRGEGCAQHSNDVCFVKNVIEINDIIDDFIKRGINSVVVNKHLEGDLIKFYGVEGTDFFDWGYASDGHSKFGLEKYNSKIQKYAFDPDRLKVIADNAANLLNVPVYGGDCIISESGEISIIDFNDWPSFSRCKERAAAAICQRIIKGLI